MAKRAKTKSVLSRIINAGTRELTKGEHALLGLPQGAQRRVAKTVKRVTKSTVTITRREFLQGREPERAGVRLSLEKLAERRRTREIGYRTAAAAEQAAKQSRTRRIQALIDNALKGRFSHRGLKQTAPGRRTTEIKISETRDDVREALEKKILRKKYLDEGLWGNVRDWLRANRQGELLDLFKTSGASTPLDASDE